MELHEQIRLAEENLERIREEYKDEPDVLAFYEPSALYFIQILKELQQ